MLSFTFAHFSNVFHIVYFLIRTVIRSIDYVYLPGPKGLNNMATWQMFTKLFYIQILCIYSHNFCEA